MTDESIVFGEGKLDSDSPIKVERSNLFNIEAEQIILGTVILNNDYLNRILDFLAPEHFYETAHQKIYEHIIHTVHKANLVADSVTMKHFFDHNETIASFGGSKYLATLISVATSIIDITDYAKLVYDLALKRGLVLVGEQMVNNSYRLSNGKTAENLIEETEAELFKMSSQGGYNKDFENIVNPLAETINKARLAMSRDNNISGVATDFLDLDGYLGGLQNSDLIILAARPSMGKTTLSINMLYNACQFFKKEYEKGAIDKPKSVGFFSLEMSSDQLAAKILSMESGFSVTKFRTGELSEDDFNKLVKKADEISKMPLFIDDTPALSISAVRTRIRRLTRKHNLGLIIIDYLQLLRGTSKGSQNNRVQEISEISMGLKAIAKEFNIPVVALSQLSRAVEQREDKRPQLSDLRESGSIEQDADVVMFIYRESYYEERKKPDEADQDKMRAWMAKMDRIRNRTDVIIAKHRNGAIGTVKLYFDPNLGKFRDDAGYLEHGYKG